MKGLLLKEIQVWFRTRSYLLLYMLAMTVVACFTSSRLSVISLGVIVGQISNAFLLDEKCGWRSYWKTLPCTPLQRVTSKYVVTAVELFIGITAYIISSFVSQKYLYSTGKPYFPPPSATEIYCDTCVVIAFSALFLAIQLPICFKLKGAKRTVMSLIPSTAFVLIVILGLNDTWHALSDNIKWLPAVIVIIGFIILGISFVLSVIIESNQDSVYKKKFKKIAVILTVIAVALGGAILGIGTQNKAEGKNQSDSVDSGYEMIRNYDEIKNDFDNIYSGFCDEFHLNTTVEECAQKLASIGYFQNQNNPEKFYSASGKINLNLTVDEESGKVIGTHAYSNLTAEKEFDSATPQDFAQIESNFYEGMAQDELHEKFRELKVFPYSISETLIYDNQPRRIYVMTFSCDNYDGTYDNLVSFKITVVTDGECVVEIDTNIFNHTTGEISDTVEETTETVLEKGKREATEFITGFCNENNLDGTPRECIKKLKGLGFAESEETFDLYFSKDRKVSVSLITDDNDALKEISAVINYGEMHYIESATEKELAEFSGNLTKGMTENRLQQTLLELDLLPDSITEKFNSDNKHLRVYEIRCRIGDYDGNGPATWSVTVDVTDGKVTDVLAF